MALETQKRWIDITSDSADDDIPAAQFSPGMSHLVSVTHARVNTSVGYTGYHFGDAQTSDSEDDAIPAAQFLRVCHI